MVETKTIFRAAVLVFGLHFLLKAVQTAKETKKLMTNVKAFVPSNLSLDTATQEELVRRQFESELKDSSDQVLYQDLLSSGAGAGIDANSGIYPRSESIEGMANVDFMGNGNGDLGNLGNVDSNYMGSELYNGADNLGSDNTPNLLDVGNSNVGNSNFDGGRRLELVKHAESDFNLDQVLNMQKNKDTFPVGPSNECASDFSNANFGSSSATPFSRSIGINDNSDEFEKNKMGKYIREYLYKPNAFENETEVEPSVGLAKFRGSEVNKYQVDDVVYKCGQALGVSSTEQYAPYN